MSPAADQPLPPVEEANKERAQRHLLHFVRQAWPVLEPATSFLDGAHIEAICEHLEAVTKGDIHNLLINVPPRHMKSLAVCVFWPVWEWISHPHRRWLFASYAMSLSVRDSLKCRRLISSPWFQSRWGDLFTLMPDQNTKTRFDNDKSGYRIATSSGGSVTGEGADRVVVDDPHNVIHRESDAQRHATLDWWDQAMSTRLNDPKTGAKVIVMQRLHEKDLSGHVLEQGGYEHLCLPAEFEAERRCVTTLKPNGWCDWRKVEGELLWPERIGRSEISGFKLRLGPRGYAGQFQQRPTPAGGGRFRAEWFRYYRKSDDASHYILLQPDGSRRLVAILSCTRFGIMDPAGSERNQNSRPCYTVIQVWDLTPTHDMVLVDQYRAQVQTPDAADAAVRIAQQYDLQYLGIEKDGIGLGVVQTVKRSNVTVKPIKARGSKEARSETAEIRMAAGMIYFPAEAPFRWDLENELLHFPNGEYADQVDALSHAALEVQRRVGPPSTKKQEDEAATWHGFPTRADDQEEEDFID